MQFFAAASEATKATKSAAGRLQDVPAEFWIKFGLGVVGLIVVVYVLRKLAQVNKVVLGVIVALALSFVSFTWIYERNEPAWATPAVQWLAGFFPTKAR
jgi:hypothetical protein